MQLRSRTKKVQEEPSPPIKKPVRKRLSKAVKPPRPPTPEPDDTTGEYYQVKREIRDNWISGEHPISFSGVSNVRRYYPNVPLDVIRDALAGIDTYTLFRPEKPPRHRNPYYVWEKRKQMQADLIDSRKWAEFNDDVNYLLCVIDIYSRFAWVEPLKAKNAGAVLRAFEKIIEKAGKPKELETDQGKEFWNTHMKTYLESENIAHRSPLDHASHVERFNQTLKNILMRYMEERQTNTYIDALEELVQLYNTRYHSSVKMTPTEAEKDSNRQKVNDALEKFYDKATGGKKARKPKFKVGDRVRISAFKSTFHKGYDLTFKPDVYVIVEVNTKMKVPMYKIRMLDKKELEAGSWYEHELQLVSQDVKESLFKIEKILKSRGSGKNKQHLIKWMYYPESENSWEPNENIKDLPVRGGVVVK